MRTEPIDATGATSPPTAELASGLRAASSGKLRRRLAGDLDVIVLKALRKEPQRRYVSVEQMAEDIRRHLQGLPVSAAPDSLAYRARKFVQRHKLGMAATTIILLVIAGGVAATIREARIAAANQRRAEKRFADVRQLANSLMYEIHDSIDGVPGAAAGRQLIVQRSQEYLDSLAREATGDISLQRELASAYDRLGTVQGNTYESSIGDAEGARRSLKKAVAIREAIANANPRNSEDHIALARAYEQLGRALWLSPGGTSEGLQNLRKAVAIAEPAARDDPRNTAALEVLARGYQYLGDLEGGSGLRGGTAALGDALENHRKALPLMRQVAEANPADPYKKYLLARATLGVGDDYLRGGDAVQALEYYQQAESIVAPLLDNANTLYRRGFAICQTRMGDALLMGGRPAEALAHYRKEEEVLRPLAAADPRDTVAQLELVTSEGDIGHAMVEAGQIEQGRVALLRALSRTATVTKTANDSYARTLLASTEALVGEALERGGNVGAAQFHYARALELYSAIVSADPADLEDAVNVVIMRNHLGGARLKLGLVPAAREDYRSALSTAESMTASNPDNIEVLYALADTYAGLGDVSAAQVKSSARASERSNAWRETGVWYGKSLDTWQRIPHPGPVSPNGFKAGDPREVTRRAKAADEQVSGKHL
ncbi:MAG: hypothetical protein LAO24_04095 [Acidobacteriia bacterium]|nr:hypothetical protein [Terriglobia bacterium]